MLLALNGRVSASLITDVHVAPRPLDLLSPFVSEERLHSMVGTAQAAGSLMDGRSVININSTAQGGGVAELLQSLSGYARGAGVNSPWLVIEGDPEFFLITKRIHNHLHGQEGDSPSLLSADRDHYECVLQQNAEGLRAHVRPGDVVILHDPQTAGLIPAMREAGATVLWRSHIGQEHNGALVSTAWEFLRPYIQQADMCIFSLQEYVPAWLDPERVRVVYPSIDPASAKNEEITEAAALGILTYVGLLDGPQPILPPQFRREDGSMAPFTRRVSAVQSGPLPRPEDPIVAQVARWDTLKDMAGVMRSFVGIENRPDNAHLFLVGPAVAGVADDPEAALVLEDCIAEWRALPEDQRNHIHLVSAPMEDREENAALINAIQRHATVIVQKSLAEGFGLTVTEAMWKGKPIIASSVGGIQRQIIDNESGILLADPEDTAACAEAIARVLADPALAERLGAAARQRARDHFLSDRHLLEYAEIIAYTLQHPKGKG